MVQQTVGENQVVVAAGQLRGGDPVVDQATALRQAGQCVERAAGEIEHGLGSIERVAGRLGIGAQKADDDVRRPAAQVEHLRAVERARLEPRSSSMKSVLDSLKSASA